MRSTVIYAFLGIVILSGSGLRTWNVNWDGGIHAHSDERVTACIYAPAIGWPSSIDEFRSPRRSPLNPMWDSRNARSRLFPYGHFPLYLGVLTAEMLSDLAGAARLLPLPDRNIALMEQANTTCEGTAFAGRLLMALLDTVTIILLFLVGRRLYGAAGGLLAAALYAYTAQAVQLSHFFAIDPAGTTFVVLAVYGGVLMVQDRSWRGVLYAGVGGGLAISTKFSMLPILAVPIMAALVVLWRTRNRPQHANGEGRDSSGRSAAGRILVGAPVALLIAFAAFLVTSPYAVLDWVNFLQSTLVLQGRMVRGVADLPFTRQYRNTATYLYFIEQQVLWGMGLPLGLIAVAGSVWALGKTVLLRAKPGELIVWVWLAPYFGITGAFLAKFNRYMSPVLPFLMLFAAGLIVWLWQLGAKRHLRLAARVPAALLYIVAVGGGLFWSLAYVNGVYAHEHTWITASRWVYANVPSGSVILWEWWDDPLPKSIPGAPDMNMESHGLRHIDWLPYEEDTKEKYDILRKKLQEADYVIYSSKRIYESVDQLPERYPMTIRYYEMMFGEELGFVHAADFTSPPRLLGRAFPDQDADESWSLYDHPRVSIFVKQRDLSEAEFDALLGGSWEGAIPLYTGRDSSSNSVRNLLDFLSGRLQLLVHQNVQPLYEHLEPLAVEYDADISLKGVALGQGEEQLSLRQPFSPERDRSVWMVLLWETNPDTDSDFAISLRLYNSDGGMSYQMDDVLGNANQARTTLWSAYEPVETLHYLEFPADLQPGEYELRLIVYSTETNVPTVEIDVWEPELLMARLQLDDSP